MVNIRKMEPTEAKAVQKTARRSFTGIEKLFIGRPKEAMVAVIGEKIVGGVLIKYIRYKGGCIGYYETAFVDPACHGQGIGRLLYGKTADFLWDQGCNALSGIVKDDNTASWKSFINNGFKRVTLGEALRLLGFKAMFLQYFATPLFICNGMELYLAVKNSEVEEKRNSSLIGILSYMMANFLILMIGMASRGPNFFLALCSCMLLLLGGITAGYAGTLFSKRKWRYHLNSGGAVISAFISLLGGIYPMIGSWYPDQYENTAEFRKDMGITALWEWGFCVCLTVLLFFLQSQYDFMGVPASLGCTLLLYRMIPVYPFESYGGGRVYRWNKGVYAVMAVISLAVIGLA